MKIQLTHLDQSYSADLNKPLDISIALVPGSDAPNCFWAPHFDVQPVVSGDWIGDTQQGGDVNFKTVTLNPHGNGTHTECVGHIAKEVVTINETLQNFHHIAQVVTIYPRMMDNGDRVILKSQIAGVIGQDIKALVIRTMPNSDDKLRRIYSGTNPPYIDHEALSYIVEQGVEHLLIDLPSVDREEDGGICNSINDGLYLLNIQIASFELDASPSKPVLYKLT